MVDQPSLQSARDNLEIIVFSTSSRLQACFNGRAELRIIVEVLPNRFRHDLGGGGVLLPCDRVYAFRLLVIQFDSDLGHGSKVGSGFEKVKPTAAGPPCR